MLVVSGSSQNIYQNGDVSNQLTDVLGGGGGSVLAAHKYVLNCKRETR